jgi:hypothetical protein
MSAMSAANLVKVKQGNFVWVGNRWKERNRIKEVVRVTPTLIILEGHREYNSYKRENGYPHGRSWSFEGEHISAFATPADRKQQEQEDAAREAKTAAREAKQAQEENLRKELSNLLPGDLYVQAYHNGKDVVESYGINGLSEEQVRNIARFLKRKTR